MGDSTTNKNQREERRKRQVKEAIEWYWNLRKDNKCAICGETHPACLELYHLTKSHFSAPKYIRKLHFSRERMMGEVEHCVFLCANCVRKHSRREILRRFKQPMEKRNGNSKRYRKQLAK